MGKVHPHSEAGSSAQTQAPHCSMDTPSPDPLPSTLTGEEEKPLALLPPVPRGRRGRPPGGAASSNRTLKASFPRKRGRPPKSGQEPPLAQELTSQVGSGGGSDLLLIDDQGVPYTVSERSAAGGPQGSVSRRAPHFCPVCLRAFPYLSDLERHSISHSELKPHECKDCGKTFKRSSHLRRHCNIHAGLRPFCCQLCPRRFREAGELAHHHRVHSGERPYQCPVCWLRFTEANTLRRHSKRKHPEALGMPLCPPDPRPETPWDEEEGIPATAGVCEEGPEGKEPACPAPSASASRSWLTARSSAGTGPSVQRLHRPDRSAWDSK
ncbi:zinc finger protein 524 isoform X2 [Marmota monax]|nr:zinc finger protein 524 isoform X2 [Marmota monax]